MLCWMLCSATRCINRDAKSMPRRLLLDFSTDLDVQATEETKEAEQEKESTRQGLSQVRTMTNFEANDKPMIDVAQRGVRTPW